MTLVGYNKRILDLTVGAPGSTCKVFTKYWPLEKDN